MAPVRLARERVREAAKGPAVARGKAVADAGHPFRNVFQSQSSHLPQQLGVVAGARQGDLPIEQVHAALMGEMASYVTENHENLLDGEFALTDFVDRFGPRLAHLNTMLAVLRPLAAATRKAEG